MKLWRDLLLGDVFVMRRERVSLEAKWADPYSCSGINVAVEVRPKGVLEIRKRTYAKGFSTARQGCLQVTGSYCRYGISGFSFKGV
jgi:hypothetical protein